MKKNILLSALFVLLFFSISAQVQIQWQKCLGGATLEEAHSIIQTNDGGYAVTGFTRSNDGDVSGNHGGDDVWVVKLGPLGNIQWQKCLGGTDYERANSIVQTVDGGYAVAGYTASNDGDVSGNHGDCDIWVVKLDTIGNIQWQKCLGGTDFDCANSIVQTADGGYVVAGFTLSNDGDVSGNHGDYDIWVVKLDTIGNMQWQKCLGGIADDQANSIVQTPGGGYAVAGFTRSNDGDVSGNHGDYDIWVVKLDSLGNIYWQKCLGGSSGERANSIIQTADGGYAVAGYTTSNDGDVSGNHSATYSDFWVVKLDTQMNIQWQKCMGGSSKDDAHSIIQTADGSYVVAGSTNSNDGDVIGNLFWIDVWVLKLDTIGNMQWQKCMGGLGAEWACSIIQTAYGGYALAGVTGSDDGDVSGYHDGWDGWVVKLIEQNISGKVFHDVNENSLLDSTEQGAAGHLVKLEPGPQYTFTNNEGMYYFAGDSGNHTVSYIPYGYWVTTTDSSYSFSIDSAGQNVDTLHFGIKNPIAVNDVAVYITGGTTRAGFETHYWLTYKNWGTVTASGTIQFVYDSLLTFISSSTILASHIANVLVFDYDTLGPGAQRTIMADFQLPGFQYLGDSLVSYVLITPLIPDSNIINNYDTIIQVITGSNDPNVKSVKPSGYGAEGYVLHGQRLSYTIDFQNTGTDTAITVVLRDTLNSNMNIETFLVEAYSHPVTWALHCGNELIFTFQNILLPDSNINEPFSHGFIRYSMAPKTGLADYTKVSNTAYIFFDYNPAVITNTVQNTYITTIPFNNDVPQLRIDKPNITIYPNPTNDVLNIIIPFEGNKDVLITNILGQTVIQNSTQEKQLSFNLSGINKGMYFISVRTENGNFVKKFVKK